jgi:hypothetical protein
MSSPDPYRRPITQVVVERRSPIGPERYFVVGIVALQLLLSVRDAGMVLELTRTEAFSLLYLGATTLTLVLLAVGALLTVAGARGDICIRVRGNRRLTVALATLATPVFNYVSYRGPLGVHLHCVDIQTKPLACPAWPNHTLVRNVQRCVVGFLSRCARLPPVNVNVGLPTNA